MSEVTFQTRGPAPVPYSSDKLAVRQGSPGHQRLGNESKKVEVRGLAVQHTMGRRVSTAPAPGSVVGAKAPAALPPPIAGPRPSRPTPRALASTPASAPVPITAPSLSPSQAMLVGQLLEMFLWQELSGPRAMGPMVGLAKQTLADLQPMLPPGVVIPCPVMPPEAAQAITTASTETIVMTATEPTGDQTPTI